MHYLIGFITGGLVVGYTAFKYGKYLGAKVAAVEDKGVEFVSEAKAVVTEVKDLAKKL